MQSKLLKHPSTGALKSSVIENEAGKLETNANFLRGLRPVVFLGRCFGALSRTDILEEDLGHDKKYRNFNFALMTSFTITLFLLVNAVLLTYHNILKFQQDKTTLVKLEGFNHAGYSISMFVIYLYQLIYSVRMRNLVRSFISANNLSQLPSFVRRAEVSSYPKFSWAIIIICLTLGVTENIDYDRQSLEKGNPNWSIMELYYYENFEHWHIILPKYYFLPTFLMTVLTKLATWGWVYMDVICVLLCRALWEKLRIIAEYLRWSPFIDEKNECILGKCFRKDFVNLKNEYIMVTELVEQVQAYISPLIFVCYTDNMYSLIVMLFNWIGPFSTGVSGDKTVHLCLAFLDFLFRIGVVTYFAGEVYQVSLKVRRGVQLFPDSMYTRAVERLERMLTTSPTGIHLFGTLMITRNFFVSIIGFIFTTEIVLLQSYSGYNANGVHNANMTLTQTKV